MSRPGKIAQLPPPLRDEINRRMDRNVPGSVLAGWLNSLPEVREILATYFDGAPINEQNLCNWRRTGFSAWQTHQEFLTLLREFSSRAADIEAAAPISMADHAAHLLSIHFAVALQNASLPSDPAHTPTPTPTPSEPGHSPTIHSPLSPSSLKPLFAIARAVATLRRGDHAAARLKLQQEALRARTAAKEPVASQGPRIFNPPQQPGPLLTSLPSKPASVPAPGNQAKSSFSHLRPSSSAVPGHSSRSSIIHSLLSLPPLPSLFRSTPPSTATLIQSRADCSSPVSPLNTQTLPATPQPPEPPSRPYSVSPSRTLGFIWDFRLRIDKSKNLVTTISDAIPCPLRPCPGR
ncbi:MAG TPA: hypothetical protein VG796_04260 [Verrucomicrobiales bacterium]|nr:hypothetical protein [Verrucomicrobiales bacterium]